MQPREDFGNLATRSQSARKETPTENPFAVGFGVLVALLVAGNVTMLFNKDADHQQEKERTIQQYSAQKIDVHQDLYTLDDGTYEVKVDGGGCVAPVISRRHMEKAVSLDCK